MRGTGLSLAIVVAVIYAAFAGFIFTKTVDESTLPGAAQLAVTGQTVTTGGEGLPTLVRRVAESTEATVVRDVPDLHTSAIRHLYVAVGDPGRPEARWLTEGYPSFSTAVQTMVHPAMELEGVDPRGRYYVLGPPDAAPAVSAAFSALGYDTQTEQHTVPAGQAISWFIGAPFGSATLVALLLIALLAGISAITGIKTYAIQRLHGATKGMAVVRDYRQAFPTGLLLLVVIAGCGVAGLWFYNDLQQVGRLVRVTVTVFLLTAALAVCVHLAAVNLVWNTPLMEGIKGRLGFRVALPAAYLIRVPGLVIAISVIASTLATAGSALEADRARKDLEAAGMAARITFEANVPPGEMDRLAYESGAWLRREDEAGRTILAVPMSLNGDTTGSEPDVLMVNYTYLEKNVVLDDEGNRLPATVPGQVSILIPEGSPATADEVFALLQDQRDGSGSLEKPVFETIQAGQSHFLYESAPDAQQRPTWTSDTVLVVVDPTSRLIRDDDYMAYASQGRVLMTDATEAVRNTPSDLLGSWISAYIPVVQAAADEYATEMTALRIKAASAIVALGVLLATAVGLAQIHVRGNAQTILVRHLHGWRFLATHQWLIRAELALLAVASCWAAARSASLVVMQSSVAGPGLARDADLAFAMWQPWAVLIVAILNVATLLGLVNIRTRLMVRAHSEETA